VLEKCEIEVVDSHKNNNKKSGNKNAPKTMDENSDTNVISLSDFEGT
jgi:hypothetical protein